MIPKCFESQRLGWQMRCVLSRWSSWYLSCLDSSVDRVVKVEWWLFRSQQNFVEEHWSPGQTSRMWSLPCRRALSMYRYEPHCCWSFRVSLESNRLSNHLSFSTRFANSSLLYRRLCILISPNPVCFRISQTAASSHSLATFQTSFSSFSQASKSRGEEVIRIFLLQLLHRVKVGW